LSREEEVVPSVNVIQPIEPRLHAQQPASGASSEPFSELLDNEVAARNGPSRPESRSIERTRADNRSERPDVSAPTPRADARQASLARGDGPQQPNSLALGEGLQEPDSLALGDKPQQVGLGGGEPKVESDDKSAAVPASSPATDAVSVEEVFVEQTVPVAAGESEGCDVEGCAELVSVPASDDAAGEADTATPPGVDLPAAKPETEIRTAAATNVKIDTVVGPTAEAATEVPIAPAAPIEPEIAITTEAAADTELSIPVSNSGLKQPSSAPVPAAIVATDETPALNVLPALPGATANAKPAPDQTILPQANALPSAPPSADAAAKPSVAFDIQTAPQQDVTQPVEAKPIKAVAPQIADNPPLPPAPDAPKVQANAPTSAPTPLPEPVRAVTTSFNVANLHAANLNEPDPVPLRAPAIAVEIMSRLREGVRRFEIRLDPPELGRIDVRLEVDRAGQATTKLTVDRPETLDLLQREARGLERALQQAGLKTDQSALEFSLRQQTNDGSLYDQSNRSQRQSDLVAIEESEMIDAVADGYRATASARGGVDIRV
jgi:chemotaxis protein MotD